jgi:hypothetical protein
MRAVVVYESMYGNTRAVATDIAAGLRATHEVTLVPVARATRELVASADLLVVGGPTHVHGLSTATSRRSAAQAAGKDGSGLSLDPDANGPGLRSWLEGLDAVDVSAACFDTRVSGLAALTGRASRGIARLLIRRGCRLVIDPESFLVSKHNTLLDGEAGRACSWGALAGLTARQRSLAGKRS